MELSGVQKILFTRLRREVPEKRYECILVCEDATFVTRGATENTALELALSKVSEWRALQHG